jgi:hypothetical protein
MRFLGRRIDNKAPVFGRSYWERGGTFRGQKVSPEWEKGKSEFHFLSCEVIGKPVLTPATSAHPFPYSAAIYITQARA